MTTTTEAGPWASFADSRLMIHTVEKYLGDIAGDYDLPGLVDAYRDAINTALGDTGITLDGEVFHSVYPVPDDAADQIRSAIESVDLGEIAERYDTSQQ